MPLVDFPAGAGGADSRHSNAQPYGYMYLCPQHGCEEYKGCALVNFCGMLQCASLNRGTGRKNTHTKKNSKTFLLCTVTQTSVVIQTGIAVKSYKIIMHVLFHLLKLSVLCR